MFKTVMAMFLGAALMITANTAVFAGEVEDACAELQVMAQKKGLSASEGENIQNAFRNTVKRSEYCNEFSKIVRTCMEYNLKGEDVNRIMASVSVAVGKDASPRQLRILCGDLLKEGCDIAGLEAACGTLGERVEKGVSPEESRKEVSATVRSCMSLGLKGDLLAKEIKKSLQKGSMEQDMEREKTQERDKERTKLETKDQVSKDPAAGGGQRK